MTQIPLHIDDFLDSLKIATARFDKGTPANKRVIVETLCANIVWDGKNIVWDWKNRYKNLINQEGDRLAPREGLEPSTHALTAHCSTIELPRIIFIFLCEL